MIAVASAVTTLALSGYSINLSDVLPFWIALPIAFFITIAIVKRIIVCFSDREGDDDND